MFLKAAHTAPQIRALLGPSRILGLSVKTAEEALKGVREGADYLGTGAGALGAVMHATVYDRVIGLGTAQVRAIRHKCHSLRKGNRPCVKLPPSVAWTGVHGVRTGTSCVSQFTIG